MSDDRLIRPVRHEDERGFLFEILRFKDHDVPGGGQIYTFSVEPGQRRGDHYHNDKHEWFTCVHGAVTVLLTDAEGVDSRVRIDSGKPLTVHAPPGTTHALLNEGDMPAIVVSYGSHQHDPDNPDTYPKTACEHGVPEHEVT